MAVEQLNEPVTALGGGILHHRRPLVSFGIAFALLMLSWQCGRYLLLGAYLDHVEGNVAVSGWR
jgi:hypothetical protein